MFDLYGIENIEIIPLNSKLNVSLNSLLMHVYLKKNPVDCFIKCNYFIPPKKIPTFNYALFPNNIFLHEKYYSRVFSSDFKKLFYWALEIIQEKILDVSGKHSLINIAQSNFVKKLFWVLYKVDYQVIYPSVYQNDLFVSDKEPNSILAIGRICKEKRYDIVIRLAKKYPNYNFKIIGGFDYSQENYLILKDIVDNTKKLKNLEVHANISRSKLVNILSKSQFLIHLMPYEHFGMVIVEALACGTTPIVYLNSGPSEIVKKTVYGNTYPNYQELLGNFDNYLIPKPPKELTLRAKDFSTDTFRRNISKYIHKFFNLVKD
jgi:glycosyltransferase involved in cell wall biosynthesis